MNHKDEEKLLMIYLNEASQQDIDDFLASPESCEQLDQLEADMNAIEQFHQQHVLPDDYGQQLWHKIADKLEPAATNESAAMSWLLTLKKWLLQPQYSLASFFGVLLLLFAAFWAGKQHNSPVLNQQLGEQLLAQNVQLHLAQSEIFLTQVSNGKETTNHQMMAQRLLSSNRIFKQALTQYEGQFTYQLLSDLEPILLQYANGAPTYRQGSSDQQPRASWVNHTGSTDLMLQIKAVKQQLATENDII